MTDNLDINREGISNYRNTPIQVLHLEDSPADAELVKRALDRGGVPCVVTLAPCASEFESHLKDRRFDLIICDSGLPDCDGFDALKLAQSRHPDTPVIVVSGMLSDVQAVESLKNGATDYVLKERLARLGPAAQRALQEARERKNQAEAAERIREQAEILNLCRDAIIVRSLENRIVFWNKGAEHVFGWSEEEAIGRELCALLNCDLSLFGAATLNVRQSGDWLGEFHVHGKSGNEMTILSHWSILRNRDGTPRAILSSNTDVTDKKKLEANLLRAQRMDSIGALAGGIAHDLNNALAPVLMCADMLLQSDDPDNKTKFLEIISSSARRATGMVKQILGFARGTGGPPGPLMLDHLVRETAKIARETFPKSITVRLNIEGNNLWQVHGDATEMHQVLLNLCVNARDAILGTGQITLALRNIHMDAAQAAGLNLNPGSYVMFSVADTGTGISPEVLPRIFEPFFSTKTPGVGTGLGLSTVAGIVKNHHGAIEIKTALYKGTEFRIYLPALGAAEQSEAEPREKPMTPGRGELVLVIDDEEAMLELAKATLETYGYNVITAPNGRQGVDCFEEQKDQIKLVVTDTDMPVMDGLTAIRAIRQIKPNVPVIIASGAKQDTQVRLRIDDGDFGNLAKPFNLDQLLSAVTLALRG